MASGNGSEEDERSEGKRNEWQWVFVVFCWLVWICLRGGGVCLFGLWQVGFGKVQTSKSKRVAIR